MKEKVYLGVDIGTTNSKILILNKNGKIEDIIKMQTPRMFKENIEYLDLSELENSIDKSVKILEERYLVEGISFSSFGESVVPVKGNSFIYEPLMWYEECTREVMEGIEPLVEKYAPYLKTGLKKSFTYSIYKILWMEKNLSLEEPDYWLPLASYFTYKYTGKVVWDMTLAGRTCFFDIHERVWIDEILKSLNLKNKLGELDYTGSYIGDSQDGIPIFLAGHDHFTGLYGVTKILDTEKITYDSMGSASVIAALTYEKDKELHFERPFMKPTGIIGVAFENNQYYLENSIKYYGKFLEWLMKLINIDPNSDNFRKINNEIEKNKNIEEKVLFIAGGDIIAGEEKSRLNLLNCPINISKPEIIQSAYIYLCSMSKMIFDSLKKFIPSDSIYVASGGNTLNETFMKYKASLLNENIYIVNTPETTALGACVASIVGSKDEQTLNNFKESLKINKIEPDNEIKKSLFNSFSRISSTYQKIEGTGLKDILE